MIPYSEALECLPAGSRISSTFGNPGDGGYAEIHRAPDGRRFEITNGPYYVREPFDWIVREIPNGN